MGTLARGLAVGATVAALVGAAHAAETGTGNAALPAQLVPPKLLSDSPALYPEALKAAPRDGEVELEILVAEDGAVSEWKVLSSSDPAFEAAAIAAVPRLLFEPARLDGKPVPVRIRFVYRFLAPVLPAAPAPAPAPQPAPAPVPTGRLEGAVRSRGNRNPIPEAWVAAEAGSAVRCDAEGRFRLEVAAGAEVMVTVRSPGFLPGRFREQVKPGEQVRVVYALDPVRVNPYETIVRAERPRTEVARVSLESAELREVPGTMGDPFRVVMLMPGVSGMLSGVAYPVVRGASPASTGYFLDGVRVPILFHLFLGPAVVHPDLIDGLDFYPGAPPPRYGRLLGGVIDGRTAGPKEGRVHGSVYADLINTGGFVEVPIAATGTDITVSGRYSYTPALLGLMANAGAGPQDARYVLDFWDYQGRVEQRLLGGKLRLFAFGSSDRVGTQSQDPSVATAMQAVSFHRVDARWQRRMLGGLLEVGGTWGRDDLGFHSQAYGEAQTDFKLGEDSWAARASWSLEINRYFELQLGGDVDHRATRVVLGADGGPVSPMPRVSIDQPLAVGTFSGGWMQLVFRGAGWTVVPGARADVFHLVPGVEHAAFEPRLTLRKELLDSLTLKGAAGLFHQAPTTLIQLPVVDMAGLGYGLQEAVQVDLGFEWKIVRGLELCVDGYVNPLLRTVEINPFDPGSMVSGTGFPISSNQFPSPETLFDESQVASHGWAYGLEVMLRHPLGGHWFGWLSYSLQQSTRYVRYRTYDSEGFPDGVAEGYLPYAFDQTHVLNAVLSYQLPRGWTVGAVFHLNTGRPEGGTMTSITMREGEVFGSPTWVTQSQAQSDRLPPFLRLDVRVAKTWVFDDFTLDAYLDVLNASFQSEIVAFTYTGGLYRGGGGLLKSGIGLPVILPILGAKGAF
ncbi:MAG TPA: TonB family protein [Myxococcales bacterium]